MIVTAGAPLFNIWLKKKNQFFQQKQENIKISNNEYRFF